MGFQSENLGETLRILRDFYYVSHIYVFNSKALTWVEHFARLVCLTVYIEHLIRILIATDMMIDVHYNIINIYLY